MRVTAEAAMHSVISQISTFLRLTYKCRFFFIHT